MWLPERLLLLRCKYCKRLNWDNSAGIFPVVISSSSAAAAASLRHWLPNRLLLLSFNTYNQHTESPSWWWWQGLKAMRKVDEKVWMLSSNSEGNACKWAGLCASVTRQIIIVKAKPLQDTELTQLARYLSFSLLISSLSRDDKGWKQWDHASSSFRFY